PGAGAAPRRWRSSVRRRPRRGPARRSPRSCGAPGGLREGARHAAEPAALLAQDEALRLGALEVGAALGIGAQAGAVALVGREVLEADQAPGDVVRALAGQEVADQVAAAARDDLAPAARVVGEGGDLEGVELVADEADGVHAGLRAVKQQGDRTVPPCRTPVF